MHKVDPSPMPYHPYAQQYYTQAPAGYYPPQPQYYQPMYTPQAATVQAAQRIAPLNNPSGFTSTMTSSSSPSHQHYEAQPVVESSGRSEAEESDELTTSEAKAAIENSGIVVQPKAVSWYPPPVQQQYGPTYPCFTGPQDQQSSSYPPIQFNTVQTASQHPQYYSYQPPQPPQTSAPQPAQMEEAHKQLFAHLQALQQMQVKDAAMPAIVVPENYVAFNLSHLQARSPAAGDRSSRDGGSSPDRVAAAAAAAAMQPHHQIIPGMAHPLVIYPVGAMAEMQARAAAAAAAASVASGSAQNSSSKKKRKDPNAPKNPLSAYLFFVTEQRTAMAQSNANVNGEKEPGAASTTTSFADVARELGQRWKSMTEEEKKPYLELARKDKERYEAEKQAFGRKKVFIS